MKLDIGQTQAEVALLAAQWVARLAQRALVERGLFSLVLAGGSTPRALYELLAQPEWRARVDWRRANVFWGDERCVPPDHLDSNYGMARQALLDAVPVPREQVHRIRGELPPQQGAEAYGRELRDFFGSNRAPFDAVLLGMGADGHTASLFPGDPALAERKRLVVAVWAPGRPPPGRVTLTYPAFNSASSVAILVTGAEKAERVAEVVSGVADAPAARVRPASGDLTFFLDRAAASRLEGQILGGDAAETAPLAKGAV